MKEPKRAVKARKYLEEVNEWLAFAFGDLPSEYNEKLIFIRDVLHDLSLDDKVKNRKLATRLKKEWEKENKQHNQELAEKAEKYDELVGKVQEVIEE